MKAKVNLSIDEDLLRSAKLFATREKTSLSELISGYLQKLVRKPGQKTIIDLVENMKSPKIASDRDLMEDYQEEIEKKYGP